MMDQSKGLKSDGGSCGKSGTVEVKDGSKGDARRRIMLYDLPATAEVLSGLTAVIDNEILLPQSLNETLTSTASCVLDKTSCLTCRCIFASRDEQVGHFKSDWHRLNLRKQTRGIEPITEAEFTRLANDDEVSSISGSDSSMSSSSEDSDLETSTAGDSLRDANERHRRRDHFSDRRLLLFRNGAGELLALHRCLVSGTTKDAALSSADLVAKVQKLPSQMRWVVLMTSGGHFAGAVFDGATVTHHKTFHRYVVRAKRGTCQSSRDGKGGNAPKSAGASLRRHNEAAFSQEIRELLASWSEPLSRCSHILLRAPGHNRKIFFGGKDAPLNKSDPRLSFISIETRRPTFRELQRVHGLLASVERIDETVDRSVTLPVTERQPAVETDRHDDALVPPDVTLHCVTDDVSPSIDFSAQDKLNVGDVSNLVSDADNNGRSTKLSDSTAIEREVSLVQPSETDKDVDFVVDKEFSDTYNELYTACKTGNTDCIRQIFNRLTTETETPEVCAKSDQAPDDPYVSTLVNHQTGPKLSTLLHVASSAGHPDIVRVLLERGADPAVKDAENQFPYVISRTKEVKQEYRRFMAEHMDWYDYARAQIPGPLTEEMELERKAKAAEKKRQQRKAKKERQKEEKVEEEKRKAEELVRLEEERKRLQFLALSDRDKRAAAAEQRLKIQLTATVNTARCWQCGIDMAGKVPFEYYDFKFCSPKCLTEHRQKNA